MREKQRRQLRLVVSAGCGPALVYFVMALRGGHSLMQALGALVLPFGAVAAGWLVYWEATTPDNPPDPGSK